MQQHCLHGFKRLAALLHCLKRRQISHRGQDLLLTRSQWQVDFQEQFAINISKIEKTFFKVVNTGGKIVKSEVRLMGYFIVGLQVPQLEQLHHERPTDGNLGRIRFGWYKIVQHEYLRETDASAEGELSVQCACSLTREI